MLLSIQQAAVQATHTINAGGWVFMILSVGFVTILMIWCFAKVLALPPEAAAREEDTLDDFHTA